MFRIRERDGWFTSRVNSPQQSRVIIKPSRFFGMDFFMPQNPYLKGNKD